MPTARYQQIRAELESRIRSGALGPGDRLPTEAELQKTHQVSRATAQRALNDLAQAGLVVRRRRTGTQVADGPSELNLRLLLDPKVAVQGVPGRHEVLSQEVVAAGDAVVELPGVEDDIPVTQIVRLKYDVDEKPIMLEVAAVPFAVAPKLVHADMEHETIRAYFSKHGLELDRARMYFDAALLSEQHAELLKTQAGGVVHLQRRYLWLINGDLAEAGLIIARPGAIDFFLEYSMRGD